MQVKTSIALVGLLALAILAGVPGGAAAVDEVVVPTTATINKGPLIDEYPGPPPPGTADLEMPFFGKISTSHPACRIRRPYQLGRVEPDGEFTWLGATTVKESGKWRFGLVGEPPEPMSMAVRVLPKTTVYEGTTYRCEEVISSTVPFDKSDFTPCLIARAEQRGYLPGIRTLKQQIRRAKANNLDELVRVYRKRLKDFRAQHDNIKRAVQNRC